ncbi:hypothetical protein C8Q74DRAFT_223481 [Fomes fomentarius]|nr:hypothetical protein C8Q74DRAFT_223481 [Fomes fomentarius]
MDRSPICGAQCVKHDKVGFSLTSRTPVILLGVPLTPTHELLPAQRRCQQLTGSARCLLAGGAVTQKGKGTLRVHRPRTVLQTPELIIISLT